MQHHMHGSMFDDILIIDSGGGKIGKMTKRTLWIESYSNERESLSECQDKSAPKIHPVVNAVNKESTYSGKRKPSITVIQQYCFI